MMRSQALVLVALLLAAACGATALETVRGVVRESSDFQCAVNCGTFYVDPDPGYQTTRLGGNFSVYVDQHVEIVGFRDMCGGCLVLFASEPVVILPPVSAADPEFPAVPREVTLRQNYPNPFNPATVIEYFVAAASHVRLSIHDVLGREVDVLVDAMEHPGIHRRRWLPGDLPGGLYWYRLRVSGPERPSALTRSMLLLR